VCQERILGRTDVSNPVLLKCHNHDLSLAPASIVSGARLALALGKGRLRLGHATCIGELLLPFYASVGQSSTIIGDCRLLVLALQPTRVLHSVGQLGPRSTIIRNCGVTLRPDAAKYKLIKGLSSADNPRTRLGPSATGGRRTQRRDGLDPRALR